MQTTVMMIHNYADKSFTEPDTFDPDRWGRDDTHPFSMLPFGFGPRSCWGTIHTYTHMHTCKYAHTHTFMLVM